MNLREGITREKPKSREASRGEEACGKERIF